MMTSRSPRHPTYLPCSPRHQKRPFGLHPYLDRPSESYSGEAHSKIDAEDSSPILPCGFTEDDDDHYAHQIGHTLLYLLSDDSIKMFTDHCHLDGRPHDAEDDYCGIYEREVDLRLESAFDTMDLEEYDSCDELEYDLESLEQYSPVYDKSINPWSSYVMTDLEDSTPCNDNYTLESLEFDFESLKGSNSTLNDILNDNIPEKVDNTTCDSPMNDNNKENIADYEITSMGNNKNTANNCNNKTTRYNPAISNNVNSPSRFSSNVLTDHCCNNDGQGQGQGHDRNENVEKMPSSLCAMIHTDNAASLAKLVS